MPLLTNLVQRLKSGIEVFTDEEAREESFEGIGLEFEETKKKLAEIGERIPIIGKLGEPIVSATDVVRFGKQVLQGIMRSAARTTFGTIDVVRDIEKVPGALKEFVTTNKRLPVIKEERKPTELKLDPQASKLEKIFFKSVFGTERISGFAEAVAKQELKEEPIPFFKGRGKKAVVPLAILATTLDFTGFGGARKNVVDALVSTKTAEEATEVLRKIGVAEDLIGNYADAFAKAVTKTDVETGLQALERFIKTTKARAPVEDVIGSIFSKLETVEAGKRIRIVDDITGEVKYMAQRSTFPEWLPENTRSKEVVDSFLEKIVDPAAKFTKREEAVFEAFKKQVSKETELKPESITRGMLTGEEAVAVPPQRPPWGMKERGFITSVKEAEDISEQTKELIEQLPEDRRFYEIYTDQTAIDSAIARVETGHDKALGFVLGPEWNKDVATTGLELMRRYRIAGDFAMEAEVAGNMAIKATTAGQGNQALSILNKLSPEGILIHAQKKMLAKTPKEKLVQLEETTKEVVEGLRRVQDEVLEQVSKEAVQEKLFKLPAIPKVPGAKVVTEAVEEIPTTAEEAAERLAKRISVVERAKEPDPIKDMVNTLYKIAQEVLPKKQKPVPPNQIELIGQAIRDKATYKEVWDKAQDLVKAKYAKNPEALDLLDNYFGKILDRPFALKQVEAAVRKGVKEAEINLAKLVKEHFSKVQEARGSLTEKLIEEAGVSAEDSGNLAKYIQTRFDELVKTKKEQVLKAIFKEIKITERPIADKIIELSNLGAFNSGAYRPLVAKKLKIPFLSDQLAQKLVAQAEKIQRLPFGYKKFKETQDLFQTIEREVPHSLGEKTWNWTLEIANIPRSLISSFFDFSFGLRQGLVALYRHPKEFKEAFTSQFKPFLAEEGYEALMDTVMKHPDFSLAVNSKVAFTDINAKLTLREERYMSSLAEKIPIIGKGVRMTNRAYTSMANKLRMDTFAKLVKDAENMGLNPRQNEEFLKKISMTVNDITGRGELPKAIRGIQSLMNAFFFSPRLIFSRLNLLVPARYVMAPSYIRKEYLKTMLSFGASTATILGLASLLPGVEVETDKRSADFAKIKVGNTRIDIMGGFQQYLRVAGQLISGKYVSSSTGKILTLGEGYKPLTRYDILFRFAETKEAPIFSFLTTLLKEQQPTGEDISISKELLEMFAPMIVMDLYEIAQEDPELLPLGILGMFGVGLQTYAPPEAYVRLNEVRNAADPVTEWNKLQKEDKVLAQKVERAGIESTFNEFDWSLTYMGVENGERAKFLYQYFQELPDDIKTVKWNDLIQKKLVSKNVAEQVRQLWTNPPR